MGFELTGMSWTPAEFAKYIDQVPVGAWAKSVTVHHTYSPNLGDRPHGWKTVHIENLRHYYKNVLGWSAGPHLFTDEKAIFGLSSLYKKGVHAKSFNRDSIGIEMLGNYESDDPTSGRGLEVIKVTALTVAILLKKMQAKPNRETVLFHRDDPTTYKTCPGTLVRKEWFLSLVNEHYDSDENLTVEERLTKIEKHLGI